MQSRAFAACTLRATCCLLATQLLLFSNYVQAIPVDDTSLNIPSAVSQSKEVTHELKHKSHVKARVLDDDLASQSNSITEASVELSSNGTSSSSWTEASKRLVYDQGFFTRFLVVVFLCSAVAMVLVYIRRLRDRQASGVYGAIPNNFSDDKSVHKFAALNTGVYEDDDDDEVSVFDASQHKLLAKDRRG